MPEISVIIPVYNGEATIAETLRSVFAQVMVDFEVLVVDDGSRDRTVEVARQCDDPRLQVLTYPNGGVSVARNRGAARSLGRYLSFIDADDLWAPDKLAAQYSALEANPQAGFAYSWVDCVDDSGQFLRRGGYLTVSGDPWLQLLAIDLVESGSNVTIRRDAFAAVGGFDESLTHSEDWDLWLRLAARYDVVTVPVAQVFYRQSAGTASANVWKMEAASRTIIDREAKRLPAERAYLRAQSLANRYKILAFEALDAPPSHRRAWVALRYAYLAVWFDRALLRQRKPLTKLVLKILFLLLLPASIARKAIAKIPDGRAIETFLLAAIQVNP